MKLLLLFILYSPFAFSQKWIDTVTIKPIIVNPKPPKPIPPKLDNIDEVEKPFSIIMTLRNYEPGEIDHPDKELFIQRVKTRIQEVRTKKSIKNIIIVGWADGNINPGISQSKFKITNECSYILKQDKIFDLELAKLRGCDIHRRLSSFMYSNSIQLSNLVDGQDEPDNVNKSGAYRKVVITIEF